MKKSLLMVLDSWHRKNDHTKEKYVNKLWRNEHKVYLCHDQEILEENSGIENGSLTIIIPMKRKVHTT